MVLVSLPKFLYFPEHKLIVLRGGAFGRKPGLDEVLRPGPMMTLIAWSQERDLSKPSTLVLSPYYHAARPYHHAARPYHHAARRSLAEAKQTPVLTSRSRSN